MRTVKTLNQSRARLLLSLTTACLLASAFAASSAGATYGDEYGPADSQGAIPGPKAFWGGTCDLVSPATAVGVAPAEPRDCIDDGTLSRFTSLPEAWSAPPSWRLAPITQAGAHPDATASLALSQDVANQSGIGIFAVLPSGTTRDIQVDLPPGLAGNPGAVPMCSNVDFQNAPATCPPSTQVGVVEIRVNQASQSSPVTSVSAVYNLEPLPGRTAEFGISQAAEIAPIRIVAKARTNGDFGVTAGVERIPPGLPLLQQSLTFWGVPWAASHDLYRPLAGVSNSFDFPPDGLLPERQAHYEPSWGPIEPFISLQTACPGSEPVTTLHLDSWQKPGGNLADGDLDLTDPDWLNFDAPAPPVSGCGLVGFKPAISLDPVGQGGAASQGTDSPTGLDVELRVPQNNDLPFSAPPSGAPQVDIDQYNADAVAFWKSDAGLATSHLKDTRVSLPEGLTLNPAAAHGLAACSEQQIGLISKSPIRFDKAAPSCPDAAKVGTVQIETPLLAQPLAGSVYLAAQGANPFGSDFATYLVLESPERGLVVKLAGKVEPDPTTGRLSATFLDNPQLPFEKFKLSFKAGPRAPLATPATCGAHTTLTNLTPYSNPTAPVALSDPFELNSSPAGGCPATDSQRPFDLGFAAGSTDLVAGAHTSFGVRLTRPDGDQELDRIEVTTPEGLAAKLAGVPYCPEAGIAQAIARTATGDGAKEQASPSCPAASRVGTTTIGAGAGRTPFYVAGKVYLAGPYKGAPVSLAFIVPAVAGPFDLGVQVVRTALRVNPKTAQVTAVSDTIPKILDGIPLRVRDIRVDVDRDGFILNPTDCSEQQVTGKAFGSNGAVSNLSNRFQIAECARLGFKPNLSIRLFGGTKRGDYQRLRATVTARAGDANIAKAAVTLPHSEFLAQEHIRTVCTRVQFAAHACPAASVYGKATAVTPLLDQPLSGPVYLRSSDNPLPDLVAALRGPDSQPIEVELAGRTDSVHGGIRNTFDLVPDAPVSKFTLELQGGKKSLIVNSRDICKAEKRATVRMSAQNGRSHNFRPKVTNPRCGKAAQGKRRGH